MNHASAIIFIVVALAATIAIAKDCPNKKSSNSKLFCYYSKLTDIDSCKCSHVILPANSDVKSIDRLREQVRGIKILITVNEFNQGLVDILKSSKVDGIEINLKKLDSKNDINDFISTVRSKLGADLYIVLAVPSKAEILAKYYDFKALSKSADLFMLQTAFLGASHNVTFHPSRLSGLWDMQNTDSVVDLVSGLGAPLSKLVITSPVQAFKFKLQSEKHTAPGSPALEVESITRDELCRIMKDAAHNWTLERDQDQAGPYIFSKDQWIAFDDATSIDIKAKYARVRGLAGIALKDLSQDGGVKCESSILDAAYNGLSRQARAPRGAVLHSLEREILESPARPLDTIQVSPYRISRVIDVEGNVHVVRQDTRTEFECSRQGYFVHPRSCGRFYRCVKFDQLSDEFSVFEFDCPAGLAFDSRVEVCVWPGSLPHASPCSGSSEIAPVPKERFICPNEPGYYADPENCRWFFACLDHGKSPLSAYEFRCPFGLVYDESRLLCEWPWLVPKCGSGLAVGSEVVYGGAGLVSLDQYDGLGVLGATRLGGLHGPIQEPVAKIYTSVGATAQQAANVLQNNNVAYENVGYTSGQYSGAAGVDDHANVGYTSGQYSGAAGVDGHANVGYSSGQYSGAAGVGHGNIGYTSGQYSGAAGVGLGNVGYTSGQYSGAAGVGHANVGYTSGQYSGAAQAQGSGLGYIAGVGIAQGSGYGTYGSGNLGLSYKAMQSLQNAGLLKTDSLVTGLGYNGAVNSGNLNYQQYAANAGYAVNSGLAYVNGANAYQGNGFGAKSTQSFTQYHGSDANKFNINSGLAYTTTADAGLQYNSNSAYQGNYAGNLQYNVANENANNLKYDSGASRASFASNNAGVQSGNGIYIQNAHLVNGLAYDNNAAGITVASSGAAGAKSEQSFTQYHSQGQAVLSGSSGSSIYDGSQSTVEYHGNTGSRDESGISGNINIVGGGYSAVGVSGSGIEISNNGENTNTVTHVTQSPISVSTVSSIPAVTSVPVPALKVASGFESYKGGVVANVPELQYKVQKQPVSNVFYQTKLNNEADLTVSRGYVNVVSSTPSSAGYDYPKPSVTFEEEPVKVVQPVIKTYQKPAVVSTTASPVVVEKVNIQPAVVSTYNLQKETFQGYDYPKPAIKFEETPVQVGGSYSYQNLETVHQSQGYNYQKPSVAFREEPIKTVTYTQSTPRPTFIQQIQSVIKPQPTIQTVQPVVKVQPTVQTIQPVVNTIVRQQPAVSYSSYQNHETFQGYDYPKPSIVFEEKPKVHITSYNVPSTTVKPVLVEQPQVYVSSTPASIVRQKVVQPAVVSSFHISSQPQVQVQQQAAVSYSQGYDYPKPSIVFEEKPAISTYHVKPAVSTYNYKNVVQQAVGYAYPKPAIAFEETPASVTRLQTPAVYSSYNYITPSTAKPAVIVQKQPAVVSSYSYTAPSTVKPTIVVEKQHYQPVVSTFSYTQSTPKPQIFVEKQPDVQFNGYDYPKPSVQFIEEPRPFVTTYENRQPVQEVPFVKKTAYVTGGQSNSYQYNQIHTSGAVQVEQKPLVVESYHAPITVSTTPKYQIQQQYSNVDSGYVYEKPAVKFQEAPVVVSTTPKYEIKQQYVDSGYVYQKPSIRFEERPVFVSTTPKYEIKQQYSNINNGYVYQKPTIKFEERPVVVSTTPKYEINQQYSVDSGYVYDKPAVQFEERPVVVENYQAPVKHKQINYAKAVDVSNSYYYNNNVHNKIVSTTATPIVDYSYVQSTPKPTFATVLNEVVGTKVQPIEQRQQFYIYDSRLSSTPRPVIKASYSTTPIASTFETVTTSRPIVRYSFSSLDDQYQYVSTSAPKKAVVEEYVAPIEVTTPQREYLPVRKNKVKVTSTAAPTEAYIAEVTTPTREYLPVRKVKLTTTTALPVTPTRKYLPVDEEVVISTRRPAKIVKVVRPKTIVKMNDFHPLLSAKLGAQCTCKSNTVRLRKKKPLRIVVEETEDDDDNDNEDDGYVVDQNNDVVVENYEYEPKKLVEIAPTPEIYIKSTTNAIEPAPTPTYTIRRRVKVRPVTSTTIAYESPVTEAAEIFLKKSPGITYVKSTTEGPSDQEIVKAVKTGLKLVKQAAKEGAKEGTREVLDSKDFDRYGPGGVRSRNERLQGTIDCQRAGLFRHPTQCNKFYACRWDCTKNRYTLHVFNCPVHLTFDNNLGACNWPSQGPACLENTLLPSD